MGRTGKATTTTIKGQSDKDSKEYISEDTISKLMKDFTCASLLTKATQSTTKDQRSSGKEAHNSCEEIVSSLKHFHLKTPVNKRTRLKEKKNLQRRSKTVLENKYNLSIAAIHSQTSLVWPGKLNCLSKKRTDSNSDVIIRPSRLSVHGVKDKQQGKSCLSSPIQTSSSEEKARLAATLKGQNHRCFGDADDKNGTTKMSFSQLCNSNTKDCISESIVSSNSHRVPASVKSQGYRSCLASSKKKQDVNHAVGHNVSGHPSNFSQFLETSNNNTISHITSSQQRQQRTLPYSHSHQIDSLSSLSLQADIESNNNNVPCPTSYTSSSTANPSSVVHSASASSITPERPCCGEWRMEESNVNELASYFEDLLHIPRKMSVMAEMMYA